MATPDRFTARGITVERHIPREGPSYYLLANTRASWFALSPEAAAKSAGWPKSTATGAALREWMEQHPLVEGPVAPEFASLGPAAPEPAPLEPAPLEPAPLEPGGFGPPQPEDAPDMDDPTKNTRTII